MSDDTAEQHETALEADDGLPVAAPAIEGRKGLDTAQIWISAFIIVALGLITYMSVFSVPFYPLDEEYIVQSIMQPDARRVAGFDEAAMPSYEGLVSAEDARVLADYIISLE